jgi:hypothetical protein
MVEKMTAVWLIILTILVCSSVPAVLIYLTSIPHPKFLAAYSNPPILANIFGFYSPVHFFQ